MLYTDNVEATFKSAIAAGANATSGWPRWALKPQMAQMTQTSP